MLKSRSSKKYVSRGRDTSEWGRGNAGKEERLVNAGKLEGTVRNLPGFFFSQSHSQSQESAWAIVGSQSICEQENFTAVFSGGFVSGNVHRYLTEKQNRSKNSANCLSYTQW